MFLLCLPYIAVALMLVALYFFVRRHPRGTTGEFVGRHRTRDISFLAQSANGFIGRITRSTPLPRITPDMNDATNPVAFYGLAVLNTINNTVRGILATDASQIGISGVASGNFPFQPASATNFGAQALAALTAVSPNSVMDTLRTGFIMVYLNSAQAPTATKVDKVYVWCAASSTTHVQGGFENAASAAIASAIKGGGNTGNGTVSAGPTINATVGMNGVYQVRFSDATHFTVVDPNGKQLADGQTAVAYSDAGLGFAITAGGTAFVAGDGFDMTVTFNTIPVPNAYFNGPGDSTGSTELAFNL
jgi:hypothetical protein